MREPTAWPTVDLGQRFVAGVIDLAVLAAVGVVIALGPLWLGGLSLPMVGATAAILVVNVLPLAAFRATLGMRLMGLEVVHGDGRAADLSELLFREMVGRGLLGAAFLATLVVGGAGMLSGSMGMFSFAHLGLLGLLSMLVLMLGVASHILIPASKSRRGLHDLMGGTWVVPRGVVQDPRDDASLDEEAKAVLGATGGKRWPKVVAAQVIIAALAVAVPYGLSRRGPDSSDYRARAKAKQAKARFLKAPADRRLAASYVAWARRAGEDEDAINAIWAQHRAARSTQVETQEAAIRAALEADPKDWDRTATLVQLLEEQDRLTEARVAFETWANAEDTVTARVSLGIWLYERGFAEDARDVLQDAQADGADDAELHAYLGWAQQELGDKQAALQSLRTALARDPELEEVQDDVQALAQELEPPP
ncbi:MAG: RDD family protein [Myxococcales bacterium]|nr:RDD family protein [Myxococcales bacterium]